MTQQQNNEWEERFKDFYWEQGEYKDRKLGFDEYKFFISQEIEKAYQKGKEEIKNQIELERRKYKNEIVNEFCIKIFESIADSNERGFNNGLNQVRLQTLEEVERVIKKLIENERDNGFEYINGEVLLQQLNKMKEK